MSFAISGVRCPDFTRTPDNSGRRRNVAGWDFSGHAGGFVHRKIAGRQTAKAPQDGGLQAQKQIRQPVANLQRAAVPAAFGTMLSPQTRWPP
jgi:hypothetical protein